MLWVQRGTPILCPRTADVRINFDIYREHSRQLTQGQDLASAGVSKPNPGVCCPGLSETPCVKSSNTNTSCPALPPSQHKVPFTLPPHHCCDDQCPPELVDNPRIFSKIANILAGVSIFYWIFYGDLSFELGIYQVKFRNDISMYHRGILI